MTQQGFAFRVARERLPRAFAGRFHGVVRLPRMSVVASRASESFVIEGGRPRRGTIRAAGNKNGALPILAACRLTDEDVRLTNLPHLRHVDAMTELIAG